tara:strand:- start:1528 stop:2040 length:513 start_codon:yes stop_codon:yes gene_type:complete
MTAEWYAAYTQPRMELWARSNLWERGVDVYLPIYRKRRRHARRVDWVSTPLFPRYLFLKADLSRTGSRALSATRGLINLVSAGTGTKPTVVTESIINGLKSRENSEGIICIERERRFDPGEELLISDGPFVDWPALFECGNDEERIIVLMNMMGRQARVRISREQVRPAR